MPDCSVIPASHPLFELFRAWQEVNNLKIYFGIMKEPIEVSLELKEALIKELGELQPTKAGGRTKLRMSANEIKKFLVRYFKKGTTRDYELNLEELNGLTTIIEFRALFNKAGVENTAIFSWNPHLKGQAFDKQALLRLWHDLYSIEDQDDLIGALMKHLEIDHEQATILSEKRLTEKHGSLSSRAIRKILPYMQEGLRYDEACLKAGFRHSNFENREEKMARELLEQLPQLKKGELRNPVVEKILNQLVNVVNAILVHPEMGRPDEIHIELSREITATAKQRAQMTKNINDSKKENEKIREELLELGLSKVNRKDIIKYKLAEQCNWISVYSGKCFNRQQVFVEQGQFDVDHIIPQSIRFDDSQSNKVLSETHINKDKDNQTAWDYISNKGPAALEAFEERLKELEKNPKNRVRIANLKLKKEEISDDFINRQLGETQYISSQAFERLSKVCKELIPSIGIITAHLRNEWGLSHLIRDLNYEKYKALDQIEFSENAEGERITSIKDWTKRDDHRHHALDALVVALTTRGMVKQLNDQSQIHQEESSSKPKTIDLRNKPSWRKIKAPVNEIRPKVEEALENILISFKSGKRATSISRSYYKSKEGILSNQIIIPRGPLHLETVYGRNKRYLAQAVPLSKIEDAQLIRDEKSSKLWQERLDFYNGNKKKAFSTAELVKNPFIIDDKEILELACWEEKFVQRVELNEKIDPAQIVDKGIRRKVEERIEESGNKALMKGNLEETPIFLDKAKRIPIKKLKVFARPTNLYPLRVDENNKPKDFVNLSNNHHVALYQKQDKTYIVSAVSLMEAVMRKQAGQSIIKTDHEEGFRFISSFQQNELFLFAERGLDFIGVIAEMSPLLFRVQSAAVSKAGGPDIVFRHHLETDIKRKEGFARRRISSVMNFPSHKIRLNVLGEMVSIETIHY